MKQVPSRFIVLEGGEGAGKSTQAKRLAEAIQRLGQEVCLTREPGGTKAAEQIRSLLVEGDAHHWTPLSEALLINAARSDHLEKIIRPALQRGEWVICDRFADSTMAYQGYAQGVDLNHLRQLRSMVVGETEPGLTIIFDLPEDVGLARVSRDQRYERMGRDFHARLRRAFTEIGQDSSLYRRAIDASGTIEEVWQRLADVMNSRYGLSL